MTTLNGTPSSGSPLPHWADELKRRYLAGEAGLFILHGNVHDGVPHEGKLQPFSDYVHDVVLAAKPQRYELALRHAGLKRRGEGTKPVDGGDSLLEGMANLELRMRTGDGIALALPHAGDLVPNAETTFLSTDERGLLEIFHDWSLSGLLLQRNHIVVLLCASLSEIHPSLNTNPRICAIEVAYPDEPARMQLVAQSAPHMAPEQQALVAKHTAGLRLLEIDSIVAERPAAGLPEAERKALALQLLGDAPDAQQRAEMYAGVTAGKTREEIAFMILGHAAPASNEDPLDAMLAIIGERKREIIQRSCGDLIEFLDPSYGLDAVGGYDQIKAELMKIAATIKTGDRKLAPMGLLAVGPMGVGKTFVIKAFLKEAGLPGVVLKNFRSKWVGSTESNLERVLKIIRAMSPIALVIDEGDRSFGNGEGGDSDGGTSSRVIARIKDFMSDTANRGHVLTILMTNRPDKLDVDIKRPGRLDRKIPFFYVDTGEDRLRIVRAILKRNGVELADDSIAALGDAFAGLDGYSNADLEAIALLALDIARNDGVALAATHLEQAIADFIPPQHTDTIQLMELLAVQESSRRSLLPERFAKLAPSEVSELIGELKRRVR
ncbi:ATP-binding protein [Lysobacter brunescens]|uniref:ATP-binding protein n=1 Tax=Lysobacter brunescens TaxID=262323 RepID=A0ABW2YDW7_9GAMM